MNIYTSVELPKPSIMKNDRTGIRGDIEKYYLGKTDSNIGFAYGRLKNGKLVCRISNRRRDIFCLQYFAPGNGFHGCNVFVDCTGKYQIDTFAGTSLSEVDKIKIKEFVEQLMIDEADYVNLQAAFLADDNRLRKNLDGKTPEEAIEICKQYEREVLGFELYL